MFGAAYRLLGSVADAEDVWLRAALACTDAVTRREHVSDRLWETLRKQYPDDAGLGHLVGQVALINAFNLFGVPMQTKPKE